MIPEAFSSPGELSRWAFPSSLRASHWLTLSLSMGRQDTKIRSQVSGPSVDEDQDAASTACVSTTSSSFVEELNRSQVKLIFTTSRRGLRCLGRGYSTPDPSPSPLPKCEALREELVFVPDSGGAPEVGANSKEEKPLQD
eukprot:g26300.t1